MIGEFIQYLQYEKRFSDKTVGSYHQDIAQFTVFIQELGVEQILFVNTTHVRLWIVSLSEKKLSPASLRRKISALSTFFKWAQKKGLVTSNPAKGIKLPKIPHRIPKYVEKSSLETLLNHEDIFSNDFEGKQNKIIIELLYSTGMRRAELLSLRWTDIDNAAMLISVKGKGNKERRVPISPDMVQLLKDFKNEQQQHFLGNAITYVIVDTKGSQAYPEMIYRTVKKYLSLCSTQKKKSPHVLRHSFATHLSANGAQLNDIKELLGHSSLASTQVYTHATIEQLKEVYKITHPKSKVK